MNKNVFFLAIASRLPWLINVCFRTDLEIRTREGHVALWLALQQLAPRSMVNGSDAKYLATSVYNDHCMAALLIQNSCNINATRLSTGETQSAT